MEGEVVRKIRAANAGNSAAEGMLRALLRGFRYSIDVLDPVAAIRELRDSSREPSPAMRYALARWIDGQIKLKRGPRAPDCRRAIGERREPLDVALCIRALLTFGTVDEPIGLHPSTRAALVEVLTGVRKLKSGPRLAAPDTLRTLLAAKSARHYAEEGAPRAGRAAIERAAREAGVKPGTLQRFIYPRSK